MTLKEFKQRIDAIPREFDNLEVLIYDTDKEEFTQYIGLNKIKASNYIGLNKVLDGLSYEESLKITPEFLLLTFQDEESFDEFGEYMNTSDLVIDLYDD